MFRSFRRVRQTLSALVVVMAWFVILGIDARSAVAAETMAYHWAEACRMGLAPAWEEESWRQAWEEKAWDAFEARQEQAQAVAEREQEQALRAYRLELHREMSERRVMIARIDDLVPQQYRDMVIDVAERFGLDPRILAAIGTVESEWNPRALGTHQDTGLMQILPSTARWIASRMKLERYDLYDPATNLAMSAFYLKALLHDHHTLDAALAVYNGGPRAAARGADHPYTKRVMNVYGRQSS